MLSRSFLKGFGRGFAAPTLIFRPFDVTPDPRFDASVEKAWSDVGKYLDQATGVEGERVGAKARTAGKVRTKAAGNTGRRAHSTKAA
jgi:hypothetical protein